MASSTGLHSDEHLTFLIKYTAKAACNITIARALDGMVIPVDVKAKMDNVATKGI
ncbi:MAG: hypothetical protein VB064_01410 [Oscillospiraceae bacterium]|nr:hypothetical protein [Oscillospiraceae bacterium]